MIRDSTRGIERLKQPFYGTTIARISDNDYPYTRTGNESVVRWVVSEQRIKRDEPKKSNIEYG